MANNNKNKKKNNWKNQLSNEEKNQLNQLNARTYAKIITIMKEFFDNPKDVSITDATGCSEVFVSALAREFREVDVFLSCKPGCDTFNDYNENNVTLHKKYIPKTNNKYNNTNTNKMISMKNHLFYAEPRAIKQPKGYTYNIGRYAIYNIANELKKGYKLAVFRIKKEGTHFAHLISKFQDITNKIYLRSVEASLSNTKKQQILLMIVDLSNTSIKIQVNPKNNNLNNSNSNNNTNSKNNNTNSKNNNTNSKNNNTNSKNNNTNSKNNNSNNTPNGNGNTNNSKNGKNINHNSNNSPNGK